MRVVTPVGGFLIFSAAQLHSTVPNTTDRTRYSIDFRTVNLDDLLEDRAAPNVDSACTGTNLGDFMRASDLEPLAEDVIERYRVVAGAVWRRGLTAIPVDRRSEAFGEGRLRMPAEGGCRNVRIDFDLLLERPDVQSTERGRPRRRPEQLDDRLDHLANGREPADADVERRAVDAFRDGGREVRLRDVGRVDEVEQPIAGTQLRAVIRE